MMDPVIDIDEPLNDRYPTISPCIRRLATHQQFNSIIIYKNVSAA